MTPCIFTMQFSKTPVDLDSNGVTVHFWQAVLQLCTVSALNCLHWSLITRPYVEPGLFLLLFELVVEEAGKLSTVSTADAVVHILAVYVVLVAQEI